MKKIAITTMTIPIARMMLLLKGGRPAMVVLKGTKGKKGLLALQVNHDTTAHHGWTRKEHAVIQCSHRGHVGLVAAHSILIRTTHLSCRLVRISK